MNQKVEKLKLKIKYNEHMKRLHNFIRSFDIKDKNNRIVQSGYQYISDIQRKIIDKYHGEHIIKDTIGEDKWEIYKQLMKEQIAILNEEKNLKI